MPSPPLGKVLEEVVRALAADQPGVADGDLLRRYLADRNADAFAALVRRHGPMVWGVCRRLLRHDHDAEDAFQATFLVLVRKAAAVQPPGRVGHFLYGVAYQTAVRVRALAARRRGREVPLGEVAAPAAADGRNELAALLDRALHGLPAKYRAPLVLCDLQAKTRREAAAELGWPEGTVAGRLARGRALLAQRLARQGMAPALGALAAATVGEAACVPLPLAEATVQAAARFAEGKAGGTAGQVLALTEGVLRAMVMNKVKLVLGVLLVMAVAGGGAGGFLYPTQAAQPPAAGGPAAEPPALPPAAPLPAPVPADAIPSARAAGPEPTIPSPPSPEQQLRSRYVQLQEELARHMTAPQVQQRIQELEQEVAAVRERERRAQQERSAAADLEKAKVLLAHVLNTYPGTAAAARAQQALAALQPQPVLGEGGYPSQVPVDSPPLPAKPSTR